jgi:hypothetical protein
MVQVSPAVQTTGQGRYMWACPSRRMATVSLVASECVLSRGAPALIAAAGNISGTASSFRTWRRRCAQCACGHTTLVATPVRTGLSDTAARAILCALDGTRQHRQSCCPSARPLAVLTQNAHDACSGAAPVVRLSRSVLCCMHVQHSCAARTCSVVSCTVRPCSVQWMRMCRGVSGAAATVEKDVP